MDGLEVIARVHSDFPTKFGIPRQSGLVPELRAQVRFAPGYRSEQYCRGLEAFSHIWLIWGFSGAAREGVSPTVRPPKLGGNRRVGVFATRSPFRPNGLGLSSVRLERVEMDGPDGPVLHILGADMMDGTPVYDIKPYLAYADCHPEASGGFAEQTGFGPLAVEMDGMWRAMVPEEKMDALLGVLANDPRPSYQDDPERWYGMAFAGLEVKFTVRDGVLSVRRVERATGGGSW